jgi:vacuolar-type H+-ATPase subunit I/STV1
VSRIGTLKDLGVGIHILALGPWLDSIDGVVSWLVVALLPPKVVLPTPITIVVAVVAIVVASIIMAVVVAPIIVPVIRAVILLVKSRSLANVFLDLLVGLVSFCPLLCHREQFLD